MGTITDKLTYLNTTKTMLKDSLNKFGSNILSTDTFRSYDTKLNEIYDKLPKVTQSGAGFTLLDVQNGQVDDFKMNGVDLEQDTTTGKNLLNISDITSGNGIKNNNNKSITLNGNITSTSFTLTNPITLKANATYIMSLTNNDTNAGDSTFILRNGNTNKMSIYFKNLVSNAPFTPTEDIIIDTLRIYNSGVTFNNYTFSIQLEEGSSSTNFEPYTGGIPSPNPDYPQQIKVVEGRQVITDKGKNIFDGELESGSYNDTTGNKSTSSNNVRNVNPIEVKPNTTYIFSINGVGKAINVLEYASDMAYIGRIGTGPVSANSSFTTSNNAKYISIFKGNSDGTEKWQIEPGSTATDSEPYYNPVSYNIDLRTQNLSDGVNENYWINTNADGAGKSGTNSGLAIDVSNYNEIIIDTSSLQTRYRVACTNTLPTSSSTVECYRGVNKDNTSSSITINTTGYNYLIINATDLTKINAYYKYELAKMPNTNYKNRIYKDNGNWYFEKNVEKVILDGSETITIQNIGTDNWYYQLSVNCYKTEQLKQMSSHYNNLGIYNSNTYQGIMMLTEGNFIRIRYGEEDTISNFKAWLSNNNVTLWYPLINSITTQITNTTLIDQLEAISVHTGTNIITLSSDNDMIPEIEITRLKELERLS